MVMSENGHAYAHDYALAMPMTMPLIMLMIMRGLILMSYFGIW